MYGAYGEGGQQPQSLFTGFTRPGAAPIPSYPTTPPYQPGQDPITPDLTTTPSPAINAPVAAQDIGGDYDAGWQGPGPADTLGIAGPVGVSETLGIEGPPGPGPANTNVGGSGRDGPGHFAGTEYGGMGAAALGPAGQRAGQIGTGLGLAGKGMSIMGIPGAGLMTLGEGIAGMVQTSQLNDALALAARGRGITPGRIGFRGMMRAAFDPGWTLADEARAINAANAAESWGIGTGGEDSPYGDAGDPGYSPGAPGAVGFNQAIAEDIAVNTPGWGWGDDDSGDSGDDGGGWGSASDDSGFGVDAW
jgi:hypothetical protein